MMIATTLAALITVIAIATALSLIDSWIRGRSAYGVLRREQALLAAGFVPQVEASEVRLRSQSVDAPKPAPMRRSLADVRRGRARRMPLPECA